MLNSSLKNLISVVLSLTIAASAIANSNLAPDLSGPVSPPPKVIIGGPYYLGILGVRSSGTTLLLLANRAQCHCFVRSPGQFRYTLNSHLNEKDCKNINKLEIPRFFARLPPKLPQEKELPDGILPVNSPK